MKYQLENQMKTKTGKETDHTDPGCLSFCIFTAAEKIHEKSCKRQNKKSVFHDIGIRNILKINLPDR